MTNQAPQNQIINGRFTGLKDFHIAQITENTTTSYSTDTPFMLARAIEAKTTTKIDSQAEYSDNTTEYISSEFEQGTIELDVNDLSPYAKSVLFGHKYDPTTGLLNLNINDVSNPVAVGWRATRSNGCKQQLCWYYAVVFTPADQNFQTASDKSKAQTQTIKGTFTGRAVDGSYGVVLDEEYLIPGTNASQLLEEWFSTVVEPSGLTSGPISTFVQLNNEVDESKNNVDESKNEMVKLENKIVEPQINTEKVNIEPNITRQEVK